MTNELLYKRVTQFQELFMIGTLVLSYLDTTFFSPSLLMVTASIEGDYFSLDGEESHSNISRNTYSGI
jgi:hypothetical protein